NALLVAADIAGPVVARRRYCHWTSICEFDRWGALRTRIVARPVQQPVVDTGLRHLALDFLYGLSNRRLVAHSCRRGDHQASDGLALVAVEEAENIDLLVGAQPFRSCRHLYLEALTLRREPDGMAHLGIAEGHGGR